MVETVASQNAAAGLPDRCLLGAIGCRDAKSSALGLGEFIAIVAPFRHGVSLLAILRREAGEIRPRTKPADVARDRHDPYAKT